MDALSLAKKLINIPSYVGSDCNEEIIAKFLYNYLKKLDWLEVIKQEVKNSRFNIILKDKYPTKLIFCGHMDTVQPRSGWKTDQFKGIIKNNKLYGLGATDMKGNLAALVTALESFKQTKGLMVLFYVDEEYDFLGMKKFIKEYKNKIQPKLIISADGNDLAIANGCRGLIEITFTVKGKTGHAGRPKDENNAILGSVKIINQLINDFEERYKGKELGKSTCNLAFLQGGLDLGKDKGGRLLIGREGNNIADIVEFVLDIRPASPNFNAARVIEMMEKLAKEEGLSLTDYKIRHNYGSWSTSKKDLKRVEMAIKKKTSIKYADIGLGGYIDTQMLWEIFNKAPCITFGAGNLNVAHKPNEFVEIDKLKKTREIYQLLIQRFANGELK